MSDFERQYAEARRRNAEINRRMEQWARVNAGIGVGALATFVVALILVVYALVSR
ncbi:MULTISPECIES: hypothetical protein [Sphingomonas]|jgi:hypothetical protein|uniref:Uncharacterized protein n=1 Tax=Sphingomonas zeae TaxID=1646122 RepID=A0A7Y6B206_9SPHN|nr:MULTISPECIES: hypothetical protein [Sphingomonas]MBB4049587.1 hypothetical protein [Sphingomonas zeae]MDK8188039.1 hypothetical protein [Sphingomonas zeae]MDK8217893.1 hypothetical protein [Sphingomonas sp. UMB7805-LC452B]NUU45970.1 hypothetical protein [Sphingomonas zeae]